MCMVSSGNVGVLVLDAGARWWNQILHIRSLRSKVLGALLGSRHALPHGSSAETGHRPVTRTSRVAQYPYLEPPDDIAATNAEDRNASSY